MRVEKRDFQSVLKFSLGRIIGGDETISKDTHYNMNVIARGYLEIISNSSAE